MLDVLRSEDRVFPQKHRAYDQHVEFAEEMNGVVLRPSLAVFLSEAAPDRDVEATSQFVV